MSSKVDFAEGGIPRYHQLATLFRHKIRSGEWQVDKQIPTVSELAKEFGVATMTIRQELGLLEKEGLIERFKAKGTFVRDKASGGLWCEVQTDWSGLLQAREGATIEVLAKERGKLPKMADEMGRLAPSYLRLRRRHLRGGEPFLLAEVFVDDRLAKRIPARNFTTKTAMKLITDLDGVKVSSARQILTIESADLNMANQLKIPLNAPVARVLRIALDENGTVIIVADGIYRGDRVRIDMKLR
jgi:GntR family transcriptional regulator